MSPEIPQTDAVVVGSGPNGLAAAIEIARSGFSVAVLEAKETAGGGARSAELTLPGFIHDVCSAIYPLALGSPFLGRLPLGSYGLEWVHPPAPLAHPFDDGTAAVLHRSVKETALTLGSDGRRYIQFMHRLVQMWPDIAEDILSPPIHIPRKPWRLAQFAFWAAHSAMGLIEDFFQDKHARGLFAGLSAHSFLPLERMPSAAFGMVLAMLGHAVGWPFPRGGSQRIIDSMTSYLYSLGGQIVTRMEVTAIDQLPPSRMLLFDVTPRQLLRIVKNLPWLYRNQLERYRYGPGVFKIDWALDGPIPWKANACRLAGTVHLGGTAEEIAAGESKVWRGQHPEHPFVLVGQQSLFDDSRTPPGKHTGWAYCHVPNNSFFDMTERIERQVERFAPGFRSSILARFTRTAREMEQYNPNLIGGGINGGIQDIAQTFIRPALRLMPYSTPLENVYICSSSTPPGGGVHGLCGYYAARLAVKRYRRK
jgi:phytoene dehydrogenase-like protein